MMKYKLSKGAILEIEHRLVTFESNTGCDLLLVEAKSSDKYVVAPWRFGVILSCLIILVFSLFYNFSMAYHWSIFVCLLLFVTIALGHLDIIKRFVITDDEINHECYENAIKYFYTLGLSKVHHRVVAMIMVSLFEKKITVLVDSKLQERISQTELDELVSIMQKHFKVCDMKQGWIASIHALEQKIIKDFEGKVSPLEVSELSNHIHFV